MSIELPYDVMERQDLRFNGKSNNCLKMILNRGTVTLRSAETLRDAGNTERHVTTRSDAAPVAWRPRQVIQETGIERWHRE